MAAAVRIFLTIERALTRAILWAACLAMTVAVVAGAFQVITRFLLERPATWTEALVRTALIWMVLLGLVAAIRSGALVSIDLCHRLVKGPWKRLIETVHLVCTVGLMGITAWYGWTMAERVRFQTLAGLEISIAWGYAAIPIGSALAIVAAIGQYLDRRNEELDQAV
ncbi:MAG: TRAP transporter small permease [Alphaproteobacteria bacterium]|nr:TRAP transporter small permease [Alphaproteobacteria bacterium]